MPLSLYQTLFDFTLNICKEYPQISPFSLRKESAKEVCIFIARFIDKTAREQGTATTSPSRKTFKIGNKEYYEDTGGDWIF